MGQGTPRPAKAGRAWLWSGRTFKPARSLPISDRGFRYGMAVFESFPVLNGAPIFLEAHLDRLRAACLRAGFPLDFAALDQVAQTLRPLQFDAFARIYVTAGDGTPTSAVTRCRILVTAEPREPIKEEVAQRGYRLGIHPTAHVSMLSGVKTANYWPNILARRLANEQLMDEALLFNNKGELISASMANVFVAGNGKVRTPSLSCGARDGVTRSWAMERCQAQESSLGLEDLMGAEEIFLTSSGIGIMPAAMIEQRPLAGREVSSRLRKEYLAGLAGRGQRRG